jgi:hypothetical protein
MISRGDTNIIRGPALIEFATATFFSADDVTVRTRTETFGVPVAGVGTLDERLNNIVTEIFFTPCGEVESAAITALFPHLAPVPGGNAFPNVAGSPNNVVVKSIIAPYDIYTFYNGIVSRMPDLVLSAAKTCFGQVQILCIGADNTAWSDAAKRYTKTTGTAPGLTAISLDAIKTVPYTLSVGSLTTPWNAVETRDGIVVSFNVPLEPVTIDSVGLIGYRYTAGSSASVRFLPVNVTQENMHALLTLQGSGVARGSSIRAKGYDLTIDGGSGNPSVVVKNVLLRSGPARYGEGERIEELEFASLRTLSAGALVALATVSINA